MMDMKEKDVNVCIALDEELKLKIVESEEEALVFIRYEYSSSYELFGLVPEPEKAFKKFKKKRLQWKQYYY